ncbi:hypothetical protein Hanom_Chr17g01573151 [Helianthus anomalus]
MFDIEDEISSSPEKEYEFKYANEADNFDHVEQAKNRFPDWKPQYPKQDIKIDPVTKEKDITLNIKPPRCLKNIPLHAMEQDFYEDF